MPKQLREIAESLSLIASVLDELALPLRADELRALASDVREHAKAADLPEPGTERGEARIDHSMRQRIAVLPDDEEPPAGYVERAVAKARQRGILPDGDDK